jgi:hypothetical protein
MNQVRLKCGEHGPEIRSGPTDGELRICRHANVGNYDDLDFMTCRCREATRGAVRRYHDRFVPLGRKVIGNPYHGVDHSVYGWEERFRDQRYSHDPHGPVSD